MGPCSKTGFFEKNPLYGPNIFETFFAHDRRDLSENDDLRVSAHFWAVEIALLFSITVHRD